MFLKPYWHHHYDQDSRMIEELREFYSAQHATYVRRREEYCTQSESTYYPHLELISPKDKSKPILPVEHFNFRDGLLLGLAPRSYSLREYDKGYVPDSHRKNLARQYAAMLSHNRSAQS